PAAQPSRGRLTQPRGAVRLGIPGAVGGRGERLARHRGNRVDGRADGQVGDPVRVSLRELLVRCQPIPREVRQRDQEIPPVSGRARTQWSSACGGSAATTGWSLSILPTFEAPPGDPSSSKNSTLAL